jgi:hypothetical protein
VATTNQERFDTLVRSVAGNGVSRRQALSLMGSALLGSALAAVFETALSGSPAQAKGGGPCRPGGTRCGIDTQCCSGECALSPKKGFSTGVREGQRALGLGKKPRMRRGVHFLLAAVTLCCLGILLSLLATTVSEVPFTAAGTDVVHVAGEALAPLAEYQSHPLTPAEDPGDTDKRPVNTSILTMLVLAGASSGVSFLWLPTTSALRQGAIRPSWGAEGDRRWSGGARDGILSFLVVFLL